MAQAAFIASAVIGAAASVQAGKQQQLAYKLQADAQDQALKDRELQRLQKLRRTQSGQRAYWAARGISGTEGSPAVIAQQSRLGYQLESGADTASTGREIQRLSSAGRAGSKAGYWKAGGSLLSAGSTYSQMDWG